VSHYDYARDYRSPGLQLGEGEILRRYRDSLRVLREDCRSGRYGHTPQSGDVEVCAARLIVALESLLRGGD
jgi:hypothetical protein